jgi:MoxR-like ATPase
MEQIILPEAQSQLELLQEKVSAVRAAISRVVVGQDLNLDLMLTAILANGHILLEGVPGVAKTLSAKLLAASIDLPFSRIQFTPDLMPSDVLGTAVFHPADAKFEFRPGPIFANLILIDEINRAPAKTQAALFEVMEERQVTIDGKTHLMEDPFLVIATQNPVEQEGTYRLPEAQLDRFLFKLQVGYPSLLEEVGILERHHSQQFLFNNLNIDPVMNADDIKSLRLIVSGLHCEKKILEYIAGIIHESRNNKFLYLGASPRASVALLNSSKALAALRGRTFITPEDIQELCYPVLRHRIVLSPEAEMDGMKPEEVIKQMIQKVEVPR